MSTTARAPIGGVKKTPIYMANGVSLNAHSCRSATDLGPVVWFSHIP